MTAMPRLASALLIATLCLPFSGCRRQQEEAPPPAPSAATDTGTEPSTMPPPAETSPAPDTSIGVGTPPPAGTEPRTAGEVVDDTVITTKVKAALVAEPNLKAGDINVDTHDGEVMLSGYVDTQDQIDRAVTIARGVEGVKTVTNKLSLRK